MNRTLIYILLCYVALFSLAEVGTRAWVAYYGDAIDITKRVLEMDPTLGWKQRPDLHVTFLGHPLTTDARGWRVQPAASFASTTKTVLVLGPSSAFGWGVGDGDTYSAQLQVLLGKDYKVINAGEIGYSTDQGLRLMESAEVQALHPDIVILAYGVNDIDETRFYFQSSATDAIELSKPHSAFLISVSNTLSESDLLNVSSRAVARSLASIESIFHSTAGTGTVQVRVPPDDFVSNYTRMISLAKENGAQAIVLSTVVHEPALPLVPAEGEISEPARVAQAVANYDALLKVLVAKEDVPYEDLDTWLPQERDADFVDPIHFSVTGNGIVAEGLRRIIEAQK